MKVIEKLGILVICLPALVALCYVLTHSARTSEPKLFPASNKPVGFPAVKAPIGFSTPSTPLQPK